jgi:O-antigen/teichoic acid export membrane protein
LGNRPLTHPQKLETDLYRGSEDVPDARHRPLVAAFLRRNAAFGSAEILCRVPLILTAGWIARSVGPEIYGTWAIVLLAQTLVANLAGMGLSSSLSRLASVASEEKAQGYLTLSLAIGIAILVLFAPLLWIFQSKAAVALGLTAQNSWLLWLGILLSANGLMEGHLDAFFKARGKISQQVIFLIGRTIAEVLVVSCVFPPGIDCSIHDPLDRLAIYTVAIAVIKILIYRATLSLRRGPSAYPSKTEGAVFIRYGIPMIPTAIVAWLVTQGDRLVLAHQIDRASMGIYVVGATISSYLGYLGYVVYPLLLPQMSKLYEAGDFVALRTVFDESQQLLLFLAGVALGGMCLFAPEVIQITAGREYSNSGIILVILSGALVIEQLFGIYQYVFHLVKKTQVILLLNAFYAALNICGVYLGARLAGLAGVACMVLVVTIFVNAVRYRIANRYSDLRLRHTVFGRIVGLACALVILAMIGQKTALSLRLVTLIAISTVCLLWVRSRAHPA